MHYKNISIHLAHRGHLCYPCHKDRKHMYSIQYELMRVYICLHKVSTCVYPFYLHQSPSQCICMRGLSLWQIPPQPEWGLHMCLDPHRSLSQRMGLEKRKHNIQYAILQYFAYYIGTGYIISCKCRLDYFRIPLHIQEKDIIT